MGKIEKLKEVNANLKKILADMETRIFVETINIEDHKKLKEDKVKTIIEPKQ
jgi:copper chaperone CopZ